MRTIIIKNLSTMRDSVVVSIVNDLMAGLDEYAKYAMKHFRLKCALKLDDVNGRVTFTVTDDEGFHDGRRDAVRHGYNKCEETPTLFECSECGEECNDTTPWDNAKIEYCPHCGVKIIGEMEYKMLYHSAFPDGKENEYE